MHRSSRLTGGLVGLGLLLSVGVSWGGLPNPTPSDAQRNTAGGTGALFINTGVDNTAFGDETLGSNTTGSNNSAFGDTALFSNTIGDFNTATGRKALTSNPTGDGNTALGDTALQSNTGNGNIAVGFNAGAALTSGDNNIYVGNNAGPGTESNVTRIGQSQTSTFIAGIAGQTVSNSATVLIDTTTGQLGTVVSSLRYKHDIQPMAAHSQGLYHLRPVVFRYKSDAHGERQYGLIAEEVAKVYPELVSRNAQGEIETVCYHELAPMLLNELQQHQRQNTRLRATVEQLQKREAVQQAELAALAARLERLEAAAARAGALASR